MEMLILAAVAAFWVKNAAVDTVAMATGKPPPSHSYRMAKLRAEQAKANRQNHSDPDMRGGLKMVARHWYLDACEDLDHWRAHRHATKDERKAAAKLRRAERGRRMRDWAAQYVPDEEVVDAEIVDETDEFTPDPPRGDGGAGGGGGPRTQRRRWRRATTVEEEEETGGPAPTPGTDLEVFTPDEESVKAPLPHRRMVLMTMLATAGYAPDTDAIGRMTSEEVDGAIAALVAHERATRETSV